MNKKIISRPGLWLEHRSALMFFTLTCVFACVTYFTVKRLSDPMSDVHQTGRSVGSPILSVSTHNPYQGAAGQLWLGDLAVALNRQDALNDRFRTQVSQGFLLNHIEDPELVRSLDAPIRDGLRNFVYESNLSGTGSTPLGRDLRLTLVPRLHHALLEITRCYTGELNKCSTLPPSLLADMRFLDPAAAPRTSMASIVLIQEDSGEVLVMAGSTAKCLRDSLSRRVDGQHFGAIFASPIDPCSQYPDKRHAWLVGMQDPKSSQDPALNWRAMSPVLWPLPPGSTAKIGSAIACAKRDIALSDQLLLQKFAQSSDNAFFEELAITCAEQYEATFIQYAKDVPLLWPQDFFAAHPSASAWTARVRPQNLDNGKVKMRIGEFSRFRDVYEIDPARARALFGQSTVERYLATKSLGAISIGGGGHASSPISALNQLRMVGLGSRGIERMHPIHLLTDNKAKLPYFPVSDLGLSGKQGKRVLYWLSGVTAKSSGFQGTAWQACLRVYGACPQSGLPELSGKTGTADFLGSNGRVKPDVELLPAKTFVARFEVNGQFYLAASQVFRTRQPGTQTLEVDGNPAAELVLIARKLLTQSNFQKSAYSTPAGRTD